MNYCKLAQKVLKRDIICGKDCPLLENCPRLILENASDEAIEKATNALLESLKEYWK